MNLTKTRIWGSPLVPSPPPEDEGPPRDDERGVSDARPLDLGKTRAAPVEQLQQAAGEPSLRISPRSGTRIMNLATLLPRMRTKGEQSANDHSEAALVRGATRILPIEQLTRAAHAERHAQQEPTAVSQEEREAWPEEEAKQRAPRNVLRLVCVALAAVCIVLWVASALVTPGVAPSTRNESAVFSPAALPVPLPSGSEEPSSHVSADPVAGATAADEADALPRTPEPSNDPRPRAAVDALVRGDEQLARSLYEELASARPEQPAFAEAARLLRRRAGEQ